MTRVEDSNIVSLFRLDLRPIIGSCFFSLMKNSARCHITDHHEEFSQWQPVAFKKLLHCCVINVAVVTKDLTRKRGSVTNPGRRGR
nr:hypothetical protein Iba_chr01aCG13380 [Ipomoea batatas]GMC50037.1 hypothetical protein Iba_chr01bCG13270 [Ipomoea batatas]